MKLKEVQLETGHPASLKKFYTRTLQFPLVEEKRYSFTIQAGYSRIRFIEIKAETEHPFYHFAFNIPANQLPQAREWLRPRAELISQDGRDIFPMSPSWNADSLYFWDPGGNLVEFIARRNLNNEASGSFSEKMVTGLGEIGVVVEDVRLFVDHIRRELKIDMWDGDGKNFAAVGDEEGLFIVVPVNRPWYPVGKPAEMFPVLVDIY